MASHAAYLNLVAALQLLNNIYCITAILHGFVIRFEIFIIFKKIRFYFHACHVCTCAPQSNLSIIRLVLLHTTYYTHDRTQQNITQRSTILRCVKLLTPQETARYGKIDHSATQHSITAKHKTTQLQKTTQKQNNTSRHSVILLN